MREIKFRVWDNLDKTMGSAENTTYIENNRPSEFNEFVFMQYTGLKDKNGVEIYEGDIVAWGRYTDEITGKEDFNGYGVVEYWSGDACYEISDIYGVTNGLSCTSYNEVIGNIYENKEELA